jgi:mannosyltransferase OCH1-like enzyme
MYNILKNREYIHFWKEKKPHIETWKLHKNYSFELCPEGTALDTHRFYEAILLNTIPIVIKNSLEPLYILFPCIILDKWDDLNLENLILEKKKLENNFDKSKLYLNYWTNLIDIKLNEINLETFDNINIPKIIHKVLILDDGKIPNNLDKNIIDAHNSWINMNPEYKIKYWNLDDCREYLQNNFPSNYLETFDCIKAYSGKCNFFRYCIIYNEGGWYSDWKQICLVKNLLNQLSDNNNFIYFYDKGIPYTINNSCVQNAFFGSISKHPILKNAITLVVENVKNKYYGNNQLDTTGVCVFGKAIKEYNKRYNKIESQGEFNHKLAKGGNFYHNKLGKIIQHKCNKCGEGQNWKNGNNYNKLWNDRNYYCE